jgi:glycosyltransferase involved in cell wall biosynthesis
MPSLACAILAKDVEKHIGECVHSCAFADAVVVFDTASADGTREVARAAGAQVIDTPFINFSQARNFALAQLDTDWVLFVDADERVTPELAAEVRRVIQDDAIAGWWIPRYNHIVGHVMKGAGWYPDYQLRLMIRSRAHYDESREVHEIAIIDGEEGYLKEHLIHYNYESWAQFHAKQERYTRYDARTLLNAGVRAHPRHLITRPGQEFWRRFVTWQGYKDGLHGLRLSLIMARYEQKKYWWMLQAQRGREVV